MDSNVRTKKLLVKVAQISLWLAVVSALISWPWVIFRQLRGEAAFPLYFKEGPLLFICYWGTLVFILISQFSNAAYDHLNDKKERT